MVHSVVEGRQCVLGDSQWWKGVKNHLELNTLSCQKVNDSLQAPASLRWKWDRLVQNSPLLGTVRPGSPPLLCFPVSVFPFSLELPGGTGGIPRLLATVNQLLALGSVPPPSQGRTVPVRRKRGSWTTSREGLRLGWSEPGGSWGQCVALTAAELLSLAGGAVWPQGADSNCHSRVFTEPDQSRRTGHPVVSASEMKPTGAPELCTAIASQGVLGKSRRLGPVPQM